MDTLRERLKEVEGELAKVFVKSEHYDGGELPPYDDSLAREIQEAIERAETEASSEDDGGEMRESAVVVGSSPEEHTAEEVTSEEAKTGDEGSIEVKTSEEGEPSERRGSAKQVDLEKESFADAAKMQVDKQ